MCKSILQRLMRKIVFARSVRFARVTTRSRTEVGPRNFFKMKSLDDQHNASRTRNFKVKTVRRWHAVTRRPRAPKMRIAAAQTGARKRCKVQSVDNEQRLVVVSGRD